VHEWALQWEEWEWERELAWSVQAMVPGLWAQQWGPAWATATARKLEGVRLAGVGNSVKRSSVC